MNFKSRFIVIAFIILVLGCSSDDDSGATTITPPPPEVISSFDPVSIKFIYEDGSIIEEGECIEPNLAYAIQIETVKNPAGNTTVSQVEYTINGALYSMSFSQAGTKRNPISLADGNNIAQLVTTAISSEIRFVVQDDFTLVE